MTKKVKHGKIVLEYKSFGVEFVNIRQTLFLLINTLR